MTAYGVMAGNRHVRINLSEQTDMMDLLGADLPVDGGLPGEFAWADGPLLAALKAGDWVLLDELNLAGVQIIYHLQHWCYGMYMIEPILPIMCTPLDLPIKLSMIRSSHPWLKVQQRCASVAMDTESGLWHAAMHQGHTG